MDSTPVRLLLLLQLAVSIWALPEYATSVMIHISKLDGGFIQI